MARNASLNFSLRINSKGISIRPYIRTGVGRRGLLAMLFGPRIKL